MVIHILTLLVDFIFPPSSSYKVIRNTPPNAWPSYLFPHYSRSTLCLCEYTHPPIKAAITAAKFEHNIQALSHLGSILATYLQQSPSFLPQSTIFVPIPLHSTRQRERGYNQVAEILHRAIAGTPFRAYPLLIRTRATTPQSHLRRSDRLTNLTGAFAIKEQSIDWGTISIVVLFDDVMTTGSTLDAAASTLKPFLPSHVTMVTMALVH